MITDPFKYNSCYCSTCQNSRFTDSWLNSNTTLVIVYRCVSEPKKRMVLFKYNACYCSTLAKRNQQLTSEKFKYNSCYCSTFPTAYGPVGCSGFKYNSCYCSTFYYRRLIYPILIQIQLLLLFTGGI